jgi:hypothetical protein
MFLAPICQQIFALIPLALRDPGTAGLWNLKNEQKMQFPSAALLNLECHFPSSSSNCLCSFRQQQLASNERTMFSAN